MALLAAKREAAVVISGVACPLPSPVPRLAARADDVAGADAVYLDVIKGVVLITPEGVDGTVALSSPLPLVVGLTLGCIVGTGHGTLLVLPVLLSATGGRILCVG